MFASIVMGEGLVKETDEAAKYWKGLTDEKGYIHGYMLVDHKTGHWMTVNLWETEADAQAHESSGGYQRDLEEGARMHMTNIKREVLEVIAEK